MAGKTQRENQAPLLPDPHRGPSLPGSLELLKSPPLAKPSSVFCPGFPPSMPQGCSAPSPPLCLYNLFSFSPTPSTTPFPGLPRFPIPA